MYAHSYANKSNPVLSHSKKRCKIIKLILSTPNSRLLRAIRRRIRFAKDGHMCSCSCLKSCIRSEANLFRDGYALAAQFPDVWVLRYGS